MQVGHCALFVEGLQSNVNFLDDLVFFQNHVLAADLLKGKEGYHVRVYERLNDLAEEISELADHFTLADDDMRLSLIELEDASIHEEPDSLGELLAVVVCIV